MPVAHARHVTVALRVALFALLVPLAITLTELPAGGARPWVRLGALAIMAAALALVLSRQGALQARLVEQARLDEELRASEAKFSGILAIAADAIITVDESQRILHYNRGAQEIFGYTEAEMVGQPLSVLLPPRYRAAHGGHMRAFSKSDDTARRMGERREIFGIRKDGTEFPAEASISKLELPGRMLFTVVLRDVTERKRAEEDERFLVDAGAQLARSLDYETVVQTIVDLPIPRLADACIVDIVEPDGSLRRWSSNWQREALTPALRGIAALRLSADSPSPVVDVIRRRVAEFVASVDDSWLEAHEELVAVDHWKALGAHAMLILPLATGDHSMGALTLIAVDPNRRFSEDQQELAEKFASAASLTLENARLYLAAQRANRARDEVLGVVSHDLRNPISAIAMCARVLRHSAPTEAQARDDLLVTISESTEWMNRLIQDLLDVANIERGHLSLERRTESAASIVEQAMHMFAVEAVEHGIIMSSEVAPDLPPVYADAARLVQVLGNLLRNSIKFTPDGGQISVRAVSEGPSVTFSVTDTGRGIAPEAQSRVFDRYWHASQGARKRGTGLGLSIAKGIIEAHGGRIWVRSEAGRGSTFGFSVPAAGAPTGASAVEQQTV